MENIKTWTVVRARSIRSNTGDTLCSKRHVVVIPRNDLYPAAMNKTNITEDPHLRIERKGITWKKK